MNIALTWHDVEKEEKTRLTVGDIGCGLWLNIQFCMSRSHDHPGFHFFKIYKLINIKSINWFFNFWVFKAEIPFALHENIKDLLNLLKNDVIYFPWFEICGQVLGKSKLKYQIGSLCFKLHFCCKMRNLFIHSIKFIETTVQVSLCLRTLSSWKIISAIWETHGLGRVTGMSNARPIRVVIVEVSTREHEGRNEKSQMSPR